MSIVEKIMENMAAVREPMIEAILVERAEIRAWYKEDQKTKETPDWVLSARKAKLDFADAVVCALPNFIFSEEECAKIAKSKQYIHLCWVEWNTRAQKKEYTKGHDVNVIEDVMEIVAEIMTGE